MMQKYNKYFEIPLFSCNFVAMKLSIVVPVYNVEATLGRCLQSIVGQNYHDFEVILVDDGSPDGCPQLCDEWAARDDRIRAIHQPNGGLSAARNTGIGQARGEYITFVDSDDYLAPDTYEQVMPLTATADIVEFPLYRHFGSPKQALVSFEPHTYTDMKAYWLEGQAYIHSYAWNKIYRRQLFNDVHFPEGRVFEDAATLPLLLQKARQVTTTNRGLYYYCMNKDGITQQAKGTELSMLLDNHLAMIQQQWCDNIYYMHVLNIQIDVVKQTHQSPRLPMRRVSPLAHGLSPAQRLKAIALNIFGIKGLCKLYRTQKHNS